MNVTSNQPQTIGRHQANPPLFACADSGKTKVIAHRVANLLKNGLTPRHIVAPTYIDKAAAELQEHIVTCCRENRGEMHGMAEMDVGTIHAFYLERLKNEVPKNP